MLHETEVMKCASHWKVTEQDLGKGFSEDGTMYTLNTIEQHSVCYSVDCRNGCLNEELSITLQAKNQGGFSVNCTPPILRLSDDESTCV